MQSRHQAVHVEQIELAPISNVIQLKIDKLIKWPSKYLDSAMKLEN